jgi:hypothetical protein
VARPKAAGPVASGHFPGARTTSTNTSNAHSTRTTHSNSSARSVGSDDGESVNYERISVSVSEIGASVNLGVQREWQRKRAGAANGEGVHYNFWSDGACAFRPTRNGLDGLLFWQTAAVAAVADPFLYLFHVCLPLTLIL